MPPVFLKSHKDDNIHIVFICVKIMMSMPNKL